MYAFLSCGQKPSTKKTKSRRHSSGQESMEETSGAIDSLPDLPDLIGDT